jgi:phosphoserine phosphatase
MDSVIVLIAKPRSGAITSGMAKLLPGARWLHHGEALEADATDIPPALREAIAGQPIDINLIAKANRRKNMLIADMDSTMIHQECIDELGIVAGVGKKIADITKRAMQGELDFEGALQERVRLLEGLSARVIEDVLHKKITFMEGGRTLLATMQKNGAYAALVSGGFTAFTSHVADKLGFDEHHANTLLIENGKLSGRVQMPILGKDAKVASLQRIAKARGLTPADALAVGDGANDIPMLHAAGLGVALHAKPNVQVAVDVKINHGDLTALLFLQGYHHNQFVID